MRLSADAQLDMESHANQEKHPVFYSNDAEEELFVGDNGLISALSVDDKSRMDKLKLRLEQRERELRQAAEYGLGLLEANEELQMQVMTLKIQLETETEELSVERETWERRTEHAQQETVKWKHKLARVEEEKTTLVEEFEQFVDRCKCRGRGRGQNTEAAIDGVLNNSNGCKYSHHLDTIAQLQTELQEAQSILYSKEAELESLRQWKEVAEQQQQEALECKVLTPQSEFLHWKNVEQDLSATQLATSELKNENDALRKAAQEHDVDMQALKTQLCLAEESKNDALVHSNRMSEELLSSESRCKRLQRELELLEHVSYFSQAIVDHDDEESDENDEESDEDDAIIEVNGIQTVAPSDTDQVKHMDPTCRADEANSRTMPSLLKIKRRRSFCVATATSLSPYPTITAAEDGPRVQVLESEKDSHKKLHHYFHLTALSIIHENNLIERCFNSSSRLTLDMWYREIIAKEVPFLMWHSWLINRISEVAASVHGEDDLRQRSTSSSKRSGFRGAFHGFSLRKISGGGDTESANNSLPSPPTVSSSPASPPVTSVPFTVARAFFRLLRKSTRAGADAFPERECPTVGFPAH